MSISVDPDQTAPIGEVSSGSTLLASILNSSVMLGNYLKQTTSEDDIFRCNFFLGALRVNSYLVNIFVPKMSASFYVCWKHTLCTLIRLLLSEQSVLSL